MKLPVETKLDLKFILTYFTSIISSTGLNVSDQLVAHATRFLIVRPKNHVRLHLHA